MKKLLPIILVLLLALNVYAEREPSTQAERDIKTNTDTIAGDTTSINSKIPLDPATETKQDTVITELQTVKYYDTGNSTTTPLTGGASWTGSWISTTGYNGAIVIIKTDQDSATDGLELQVSKDGVNPLHPHKSSILANTPDGHHVPVTLEEGYFRVKYTNGATPQGTFVISTTLFEQIPEDSHAHPINFTIDDSHPAAVNRSIITVKKPNGLYTNVQGTTSGNLKVSLEEFNGAVGATGLDVSEKSRTAFDEVLTAELTPVIQLNFNYNINTDIVTSTVTGSGTVTQADSMVVLSTTAATNSSAKVNSRRVLRYAAGTGAEYKGTGVFTTCTANSTQLLGVGDSTDGFFFGCNGASFGVMRRQNSVDTWTAKASWSEDIADGTGTLPLLDITKGNVYRITYQWLGFGMISFWIENPSTGRFVKVHQIEYANANTVPSIYNPSLPVMASVTNTTNNTNIVLKSSSMQGALQGINVVLGPRKSISNTKSGITTETNVLTIRNKSTFATKTNKVPVKIDFITIAVDGTKNAVCRIVRNATLGGTPSYTDISTNTSVMDYDVAGTTITGGQPLFTFALAKVDNEVVSLHDLNFEMIPTDTLTIGCTSSSATEATASISWIERF